MTTVGNESSASAESARTPEPEVVARRHFPEYFCEFLGTAIMMTIGIGAVALMWGEGSPMPEMIPWTRLRLFMTGFLFAGGATLVVYSRLGQRSGAHVNPAVTLAFWRLGKIEGRDAVAYVVAQFLGGVVGVLPVVWVASAAARSIQMGTTSPGEGIPPIVAFGAEMAMTFALVLLIFVCVNRPKIAPRTGIYAGTLVMLLVGLEAPVSGTSLNPARSLGPALLAATVQDQWIYLLAPPLGALLAVAAFRRFVTEGQPLCGKLYHTERYPCIFSDCGYQLVRAGETLMREEDAADRAYVIDRGEFEVRKGAGRTETVLARLGPNDWVGEMALLLDQPRSATVVAVTDGQVRPITRDNFAHVIAEHPETSLKVMRQLARRLAESDDKIVV